MGKAGGGVEKGSFSLSALSLLRFHLSPFPPETPDTQAKLEPQPRTTKKKTIESLFLASACSKRRSDSGEQREEKLRRSLLEFDSIKSSPGKICQHL